MYVFQLFDTYSGSGTVLLVVVFCEAVSVGWVYGEHFRVYGLPLVTEK